MENDIKIVAQKGTNTNTCNIYKCGYKEGHCNTYP